MTLQKNREIRFTGLPLSEGVALGRVCLFNERRHSNLPVYHVDGEGRTREKNRIARAIELTSERLRSIIEEVHERLGEAHANIFVVQRMMVDDPSLLPKMHAAIDEQGLNAEAAATRIFDAYEAVLLEVDDAYIKERATDIGEVKRRILDVLGDMNPSLQCAGQAHCQRGRDRIILAEELTPSLTVDLDTAHTLGFVTEKGGAGAHAAILARALGIPAVSGIHNLHGSISCGSEMLVNGNTGEVIVWPSPQTLAAYPTLKRATDFTMPHVEPVPGLTVMANISRAGDIEAARAQHAEGIGLYRTEFEFLGAGRMLEEDEQYELYTSVIRAMHPAPVTFRMLDLGGDKAAPFLNLPQEENPYLGFRGARLLLGRPEWFRPQARALARASRHGLVNVLYPMIVDVDQFRQLKTAFQKAASDLLTGDIRHGAMFEVPSACLQAKAILSEADFGSVGTNDLIQYLFAVDRNNEWVAADYTPDRPVLWEVLENLLRIARETGRSLSICGEMANHPAYLGHLMRFGAATVSVSARMIPQVRLLAKHHAAQRENLGGTF